MYVDFKTTVWERVMIPDIIKDEFVKKLKEGIISTANDAIEEIENSEYSYGHEYEVLLDTSEQLDPKDNGGSATIELHEENTFDSLRWNNSTNK